MKTNRRSFFAVIFGAFFSRKVIAKEVATLQIQGATDALLGKAMGTRVTATEAFLLQENLRKRFTHAYNYGMKHKRFAQLLSPEHQQTKPNQTNT